MKNIEPVHPGRIKVPNETGISHMKRIRLAIAQNPINETLK